LGNIEKFEKMETKPEAAISFMVDAQEYFIPLADNIDIEAEIAKLEEDLKYQQGFLKSVEKKLSNERFVSKAPDKVVEVEKKKKTDTVEKIEKIEEMLKNLEK
jgi:valyl-tRNA synthetase